MCLLPRRLEDQQMFAGNRRKKVVTRFRGRLVKMVKDTGIKFNDYSISPKITLILMHWGYELTENDFFNE